MAPAPRKACKNCKKTVFAKDIAQHQQVCDTIKCFRCRKKYAKTKKHVCLYRKCFGCSTYPTPLPCPALSWLDIPTSTRLIQPHTPKPRYPKPCRQNPFFENGTYHSSFKKQQTPPPHSTAHKNKTSIPQPEMPKHVPHPRQLVGRELGVAVECGAFVSFFFFFFFFFSLSFTSTI